MKKDKLLSKAEEALAREALRLIESERYITSICQANSSRHQKHLQVDCRDLRVKPLTSPIQLWPVPINKANTRLGQLTHSPDLSFNNQRGSRRKCSATNEVCQHPFICSTARKNFKKKKKNLSYWVFCVAPGKSLVINSLAKQRFVITFVTKAPGYDWIPYSQCDGKIRQSAIVLLLAL